MTPAASDELLGISHGTLAAMGDLATGAGFLIAAIAAIAAWRQFKESRQARIDQNRPYVLVTFERSQVMLPLIDLVVRNVGAGPARNVRIRSNPLLTRARDIEGLPQLGQSRFFTEAIPLLPPNHEFRMHFDSFPERTEADLPQKFSFAIQYDDGHGNQWREQSVQDLGLFSDLLFDEVYGEHHAAKALREIAGYLKNAGILSKTPAVEATVETRTERDERVRQRAATQRSLLEQAHQRLAARADDDGTDEPAR